MRHIDNSTLKSEIAADSDKKWLKSASRRLAKINSVVNDTALFTDARRILFNSGHWSDKYIKDKLIALSNNKCWYCEASLSRQHGDVDHFRPKGAVEDDPNHPGYWWLTLEPSNFRLSCVICNQFSTQNGQPTGKRNWFPLLDGSFRAYTPDDDINLEHPMLLDPTNAEDVKLIAFDLDGVPRAFFEETTDAEKNLKAVKSIEVFALAQSETCRLRSRCLHAINAALKTIVEIEAVLERLADEVKARFEHRMRELKAVIEESIDAHAEFLSASVYILKYRRGHSSWLDDLLHQYGYWD